jgi:hypothetical protein
MGENKISRIFCYQDFRVVAFIVIFSTELTIQRVNKPKYWRNVHSFLLPYTINKTLDDLDIYDRFNLKYHDSL